MLKFIKNILLISYLKNKGVRRICFILGILLAIFPSISWYEGLSDNFINERYENIIVFGKQNRYNTDKQKEVYNKYPANIGVKNLSNFDDWRNFMFDDYGDGYEARRYYFQQCYALKNKKNVELPEGFHIVYIPKQNNDLENKQMRFKIQAPDREIIEIEGNKQPTEQDLEQIYLSKNYDKLLTMCPKLKQYMTQEISISKANYLYLLKLLWALFWFYLPFLLSCIIRWIYTGFKEK